MYFPIFVPFSDICSKNVELPNVNTGSEDVTERNKNLGQEEYIEQVSEMLDYFFPNNF